jgi:drug/metabolite transporter (DMT)-like permease
MLLGKVLSQSKLVALVIIFFGLSMSAFGSSQGSALSTADSENTSRKLLGIGFTLLCTSMYGLHYAVSESIVGQPNPPPTTSIQAFSGLYTLVALGAYTLWHTIPNFDLLFLQNIRAADGDVWLISIIYPLLVLSAFLHSITYFRLLSTLGSVSTGVLQSLRAVSVFALSSLLFCDAKHQENCFNMMKLASTAVVVSGILIYTSVSSSTGAKKEPEAEKITSL